MNGTSGSQVFTDEQGLAWGLAWLVNGAAQISTATYKYGGASGSFTGAKSYISTPHTQFFNFSTNDYTLELWVNTTNTIVTGEQIISKGNDAQTLGWGLDNIDGTQNGWTFWMGDHATGVTPAFTITPFTWTHLVIERESGTTKIFINGNLTVIKTGLSGNYDTINNVVIGYLSPNKYYSGFLDEMRFTTGIARWKSNFTTPYNEYRGTLETDYPDINPNSTFKYIRDPTTGYYIDNLSQVAIRTRTFQLQNISNASYIVGSILIDPLHLKADSVSLNTTDYPTGMTLLSSNIYNNIGLIEFNVSKPTGFSPGINCVSIIDYTVLYYNYSDGSDNISHYFGYGFLINGTSDQYYPIHNFLYAPVLYGDWNFTANFSVDSLTPLTGYPVQFVSTFNGSYPNRWNWSFGDGTFNNGTNSTINHAYTTTGLKTVSLTEYIWQNTSVTNTTIKTGYINVTELVPVAAFTSSQSGGYPAITVAFTDTSTNFPTSWYWIFGDGNTSILQNPTNSYTFCGNFTVEFRASNYAGFDWENKTDTVVISCTSFRPASTSEKLATKVMDTQNIIVIGVLLVIAAGITVYTVTLFTKKSG